MFMAFFVCQTAAAASFNCKKASTPEEKLICSDAELSKLDEEMAAAYKTALALHPLPSFVRAQQKEWLEYNKLKFCGPKKEDKKACLQKKYTDRLAHLSATKMMTVYSNDKTFSYEDGDLAVEVWDADKAINIKVWGGFVIHMEATRMSGENTYTGCEFRGILDDSKKVATSSDPEGKGVKLNLRITGTTLQFDDKASGSICTGFGRIPELVLKRVAK